MVTRHASNLIDILGYESDYGSQEGEHTDKSRS